MKIVVEITAKQLGSGARCTRAVFPCDRYIQDKVKDGNLKTACVGNGYIHAVSFACTYALYL